MHTRFKNSILIGPLKVLICMKMCAQKKKRKNNWKDTSFKTTIVLNILLIKCGQLYCLKIELNVWKNS